MTHRPISEFEIETGIAFHSQKLLLEAFIHSSFANEASPEMGVRSDNERLEFLGDAVIEFVVSKFLFDRYPDLTEGELTRLRSALVRRETLSRIAASRKLGDFLILGKGEEESGGRYRSATLCATYEAVAGAIYLDQGLAAVEAFVMPDLSAELKSVRGKALGKDSKSRLQEWTQREFGVAPRYNVVESDGPDHAKTFVIEALVMGLRVGVGKGTSKQEASQEAASQALVAVGLACAAENGDRVSDAAEWAIVSDVLERLYEAKAASA